MPGKKKPAKKKVARKVSVPPTDAGAVARRAPRTSVGQDVVEGDVDLEEEVEEEDEVVAEGNRPAEIVRRVLEVGLLEEDESVERWFTDTREAGDLAHGVHGVVVVRLALGEEDIKGLPELPSSWQDLLLLDVNAQALGVIAVVDSRSVLAWPNGDAMPHTLLPAALYEFVGERLLMVSISLSVGERDALFTTMNASLRKRVAKTLTHKYAVLNDGTLFPNPVASDVDSISRTDSFVRYMGCASDEWNEHGPIQCVPPPLSVNYHPDCSNPFVPLEHAATMSKVHLARQLYALPPMVQFLKDAKGVPTPWESFTHFSAPLLVRRRQAIPYCGDVLGHGVQGATFFFKCPPGPEEPPCPLARFHRWYLPKASFDGGTRFTVEKGSLVFTFATCGYVLRRDEDGLEWMEWATMGHVLHVAPASVAEAVEQKWVVQRPTATGGMAYSCGCMDHCDNYGEVCISCACGTYAPRACCASASYALRFWCVRVDLPTGTRRPHRSYVLG